MILQQWLDHARLLRRTWQQQFFFGGGRRLIRRTDILVGWRLGLRPSTELAPSLLVPDFVLHTHRFSSLSFFPGIKPFCPFCDYIKSFVPMM